MRSVASTPAQREREAACAALDEQFAAGRLDVAEYADRYVRVTAATRPDEVAAALGNYRLPGPPPQPTRRYHPRARAALTVFRVIAAIGVLGLMLVYGAWWAMWLFVPLLLFGRDPYV